MRLPAPTRIRATALLTTTPALVPAVVGARTPLTVAVVALPPGGAIGSRKISARAGVVRAVYRLTGPSCAGTIVLPRLTAASVSIGVPVSP